MWHYRATITRLVDGDSIHATVDLGFYLSAQLTFRLLGIDAPEMVGATRAAGEAAKAYLETILPVGSACELFTTKGDSFGRWLCDCILPDGRNVGQEMLKAGHAVPYRR